MGPTRQQDTGHAHALDELATELDTAPSSTRMMGGNALFPTSLLGPPATEPTASDQGYGMWETPTQGQWTQGGSGHKSDPVNLYVHGSLPEILDAFARGHWTVAAAGSKAENKKYVENAAGEALIGKPARGLIHAFDKTRKFFGDNRKRHPITDPFDNAVQSMPMSDQWFEGKKEVASLEMGNNPTGGLHHFRIFATGMRDGEGRDVWAIAASRDIGIVFDKNKPETGFTTHIIEPNTDGERDLVLATLQANGHVEHVDMLHIKFGARKDGATSHGAWDVDLAR
jgi:hypothetical protein